MQNDQKLTKAMGALAVDGILKSLSLITLSLWSILHEGLRHGIITYDDYSALQRDYKIFVRSATILKATLNDIFAKLVSGEEPKSNKGANDDKS